MSLESDFTIPGEKVQKQRIITDPIDLPARSLTITSIAKAALVTVGTVVSWYLVRATNLFSWGSKNSKEVNGNEIMEVQSEGQSLAVRSDLEEIGKHRSLFTTRGLQSYDDEKIVEFKEMEIQEFTIEELDDLPEAKRKESSRRSISIKNTIPNQNAIVGKYFELTIDGNSVFNSNTVIVVDAKNITSWMTSSSFSTLIGYCDIHGSACDVALSKNYAYLAVCMMTGSSGILGLQIIDITDPRNPTLKGFYNTTPNYAHGIALSENYAYLTVCNTGSSGIPGLQIIDITDPANPTFKGSYDALQQAQKIALFGNYAYVADLDLGLQIIDISDPANPTFTGSYDTPGTAYEVALSGSYAYLLDSYSLQIIDISNLANPTFKGSYDTHGDDYRIVLSGNYAYMTDLDSGLQIINITDPANPTFKGSYDTHGNSCLGIDFFGNYVYMTCDLGRLIVVDIADPANPTFKTSYELDDSFGAIALSGNYAYVGGINILQIISSNLDKLILKGVPNSAGTYRVDIRGCNEINECITDSFDIIVTPPVAQPSFFKTLIIISFITTAICIGSLCGVTIGEVMAFRRYYRERAEQQIM